MRPPAVATPADVAALVGLRLLLPPADHRRACAQNRASEQGGDHRRSQLWH